MSSYSYLNSILSGSIGSSATLNTQLAIGSNKVDFIEMLNTPHQIRQIVEDSSALAIIAGSATAKALLFNSTVAVTTIASSYNATLNIFNNSVLGREILINQGLYGIYRNNRSFYNNLKSVVDNSKLKRAIFYSNGTLTKPSSGWNVLSFLLIGLGGTGSGSGTAFASGGGAGVTNEIVINPTNDANINISTGASDPCTAITASGNITGVISGFAAATGGTNTGGGADTEGGIASLTDTDIFNSAFQIKSFAAKGENGYLYGTATPGPYPGSRAGGLFNKYGMGTHPDGAGSSTTEGRNGLVIVHYLEN